MRGLKVVAVSMWIVMLLGCASVSVNTDYDRKVDFSKFRTYSWRQGDPQADDLLMREPFFRKRVKEAVDTALQSKGFTPATDGTPDFHVAIHAGVKERMRVTNWGDYGWYDPWWGPYNGRVDVSYYTQGTLVIDVYDAGTRELAWRGQGEGIVREYADSEKREENLRKTVSEILKTFPPKNEDPQNKD